MELCIFMKKCISINPHYKFTFFFFNFLFFLEGNNALPVGISVEIHPAAWDCLKEKGHFRGDHIHNHHMIVVENMHLDTFVDLTAEPFQMGSGFFPEGKPLADPLPQGEEL